ncbi:hypothetical protein GSI_10713 [Ganoderma sinense ZZ0214-1]|uniref:Uncharacterized protein n=1 Tax=Ganoderma sinense ZZ0214-1 TaxID=1077348 RepID=A0A2G8S1B5_9APHY|nr:hypothetical protein GSI_10713 [Ganoderma sinense ZZ0214-1]
MHNPRGSRHSRCAKSYVHILAHTSKFGREAPRGYAAKQTSRSRTLGGDDFCDPTWTPLCLRPVMDGNSSDVCCPHSRRCQYASPTYFLTLVVGMVTSPLFCFSIFLDDTSFRALTQAWMRCTAHPCPCAFLSSSRCIEAHQDPKTDI